MSEATLHPMLKWWRTKSRWSDGTDFPADALSEGRLAADAWNATLDDARRVLTEGPELTALYRLDDLKYKP